MNNVFYPSSEDSKSEQKKKNNDWQVEENYLNLWSYLRRRYPNIDLEQKNFFELIQIKTSLEGPHQLREWNEDIASVRKH
tara:strand:+ start:425 stop:664 length:240 start_codon:yes stop_codon:yes gene_type:complete